MEAAREQVMEMMAKQLARMTAPSLVMLKAQPGTAVARMEPWPPDAPELGRRWPG